MESDKLSDGKGDSVMRMRPTADIRRRRKAKIERIRRMQPTIGASGAGEVRIGAGSAQAQDYGSRGLALAPQVPTKDGLPPPKDPEEAWKRRMASWSGQPSPDDVPEEGKNRVFPAWGGFSMTSLIISILLFALIWGVHQLDAAWAKRAQSAIAAAMQEPIETRQVMNWYASTFGGSPAWIPLWKDGASEDEAQAVHAGRLSDFHAPVRGVVVSTFAENRQGVRIRVNAGEPVLAAAEGRIIFSGYTSSGLTVVIQHPDRVRTIYGWLEDVLVAENDWVEQGDPIAQGVSGPDPSGAGDLFFAVRAGEEYVDPAVVVKFD